MRVRADGLVRVFRGPPERRALDGLDADFAEGDVHAVIGPNGSGKTTLLRILALLDRPDAGCVLFDGVPVRPCREDRRRATMAFDRAALLRGTVRWNLRFALRAHGVPRADAEARIAEWIEPLALGRILDSRVDRISAGEARRAAMARAFSLRTELLLLDEPTANLDPPSASLIESAVRSVAAAGRSTVVLATHDLTMARDLAGRVHFLADGRIRQGGTAGEVFDSPGSRQLAEFVGLENVFRGVVEMRGDRQVFVGPGIEFVVATERAGPAFAGISAREILLSREAVRSSAMNSVGGTIASIERRGPLVLVTVRGAATLTASITPATLASMAFFVGEEILLTFKATSVRLFDA